VPGKQAGKKEKSRLFIVFIPKYNGHKDIMVRANSKLWLGPETAAAILLSCLAATLRAKRAKEILC
jgi:hypothetical protein